MKLKDIKDIELSKIQELYNEGYCDSFDDGKTLRERGIDEVAWTTYKSAICTSRSLERVLNKNTITLDVFWDNYEVLTDNYKELTKKKEITFMDLQFIGLSEEFLLFCIENNLIERHRNGVFMYKFERSADGLSLDVMAALLKILEKAPKEIQMNPEDFIDKYVLYLKIHKELMKKNLSGNLYVDALLHEYGFPAEFVMFCTKYGLIDASNPSDTSYYKIISRIMRMIRF